MNETLSIAELMATLPPGVDSGLINYLRDTFPVLLASSVAILLGAAIGLIVHMPGFKSAREYRRNLESRLYEIQKRSAIKNKE